MLIVLKAIASAVSIGSGFRGGLFFASLFLGAMVGKLFAGLLAMVTTTHAIPPVVCAIVAHERDGGRDRRRPADHGFLALEETGSLPMTIAVLAACVDLLAHCPPDFRLLLRDLALPPARREHPQRRRCRLDAQPDRRADDAARGAHRARRHASRLFRRDFPLGATQRVVAVDDADRYAGIVLLAEAHADTDAGAKVADILHYADAALLPQMTVKQAIAMFESAESDALAVFDGPGDAGA